MNSDRMTTILGALTGIAVAIQGGLINIPTNRNEAIALVASLFLAATGYYTNKPA